MSEIPEVFAIFEQKLANVLSFTIIAQRNNTKQAIEELLAYFSGIVECASKAESRIAELEAALTNARELVGMTPPPAFPEWIPVTEKLPEEDCDVLAVISGETSLGRYYKEFHAVCDFIDGLGVIEATHWMPLPQPPEVQA